MEESESVKSSEEESQSDSILDSRSDKSGDSKGSSDVEVDSEWSEADEIFGANTDEFETMRGRLSPEAQCRFEQLMVRAKNGKELLTKFGTIGVVIYYKALQYGTTFDENKLKAVFDSGILDEKSPIDQIVYEVLQGIKGSFDLLERVKPRKTKEAYQFLQMIYKLLPSDNKKLRRLTLEKNIPKLTSLV